MMSIHCLKPGGVTHSDVLIHCLKPGGVAYSVVEAIATVTVHLSSRDCDGDEIPLLVPARLSMRQTSRHWSKL